MTVSLFPVYQPENILCVSMDSNDIKLVDFGLARNLDAAEETKSSFGTPDFVGKNERFSDQFNYHLSLVIQALVLLLQIGKGKKKTRL